jgi:hypothetical protein
MQPSSRWLTAVVFVFTITAALSAQSAAPYWVESGKKSAKPKSAKRTAADPGLSELRDLVAAQQQQLDAQRQQLNQLKSQLQQLLDATQQANAAAQKVQSSAEQAQNTSAQAQQSAAEAQRLADQASANAVEAKTALSLANNKSTDGDKKLAALQDFVNRFRFNGDVRLRGESFFQDCAACLDRNRARIRVRFGLEGKLGEDFVGGVALATGSLGDPTTTNETFTNFFDRKTIGLDKGYITYQPVAHKWVQVTGGKFVYTWNRTQVTGDPDLNPEGFSEKFTWDLKTPAVKSVTFQLMQTFFSEASAGTDSYALGGQIASKLHIGPLTSTPSFLLMKWNNPDAILQASGFAVQFPGNTTSPGSGEGPGCAKASGLPTVPPCAFSPNGMTNATYNDAGGNPHFLSQFLYADFILNNQIKTGWDRFPLNLLLEYENNLDAKDHPFDSQGNVLSSLGKQSHTYYADMSLGQTKNKNDIQIGYAWLRQEQDAVIASFAESDQRAPTNILQNRFYALWKLRSNTVAGYTFWYGRTLNSALQHATLAPGTTLGEAEPYLKRMQFDLSYTF